MFNPCKPKDPFEIEKMSFDSEDHDPKKKKEKEKDEDAEETKESNKKCKIL